MKRLAFAALLSLAIHALVFSMDASWLTTGRFKKPQNEPLTLFFTYRATAVRRTPPKSKVIKAEKPRPLRPPPPKQTPLQPPRPAVKKTQHPLKKKRAAEIQPERLPEPSVKSKKKDLIDTPDISARSMPAQEVVPPGAPSKPIDLAGKRSEAPETAPAQISPNPGIAAAGPEPEISSASAAEDVKEAFPLYKNNPAPPYPRRAQRRGYQGTVVLEVRVTREGTVREIRVFQSSGYAVLDESAKQTVKTWLFEPGKMRNRPVQMWVKVPIRFQLK